MSNMSFDSLGDTSWYSQGYTDEWDTDIVDDTHWVEILVASNDEYLAPRPTDPNELLQWGETLEMIGNAYEYGLPICDCYGADHPYDCDIWRNKDWVDCRCEWDDTLFAFIYPENEAARLKKQSVLPAQAVGSNKGYANLGASTFVPKCRHKDMTVTLPNGVKVYASSYHARQATDNHPDYGVYLDRIWNPYSYPSLFLPWQDYGLPEVSDQRLTESIDWILDKASEGIKVEIGCIGGHGRTGTLLALLVIETSDLTPKEAVDWVRENYCKEAIESDDQEHFVRYYQYLIGKSDIKVDRTLPPKPKKQTTTNMKEDKK